MIPRSKDIEILPFREFQQKKYLYEDPHMNPTIIVMHDGPFSAADVMLAAVLAEYARASDAVVILRCPEKEARQRAIQLNGVLCTENTVEYFSTFGEYITEDLAEYLEAEEKVTDERSSSPYYCAVLAERSGSELPLVVDLWARNGANICDEYIPQHEICDTSKLRGSRSKVLNSIRSFIISQCGDFSSVFSMFNPLQIELNDDSVDKCYRLPQLDIDQQFLQAVNLASVIFHRAIRWSVARACQEQNGWLWEPHLDLLESDFQTSDPSPANCQNLD